MFCLGQIIKPQGIKGEVKIRYFADAFADSRSVKEVVIGGQTFAVQKLRVEEGFACIKLKGVEDRNAAELLRGQELLVDENNRPKLSHDRYYISDIIGCRFFADGVELGTVTDVLQNVGADVWEVSGEKPFMFAFVEGVIKKFDFSGKLIEADAKELAKVAVYED
jgi:16S rRNA processing protein RimM